MQPPIQSPQTPSGSLLDSHEQAVRNWAMACHLMALLLFVGVPFGNIFGPLLVWLYKGKDAPLIDDQGREAVNFGITMTIFYFFLIVSAILWIGIPTVLLAMNKGFGELFVVGISAWLVVLVFPMVHFLLIVVGGIRAANGKYHRYPFTIRFIN